MGKDKKKKHKKHLAKQSSSQKSRSSSEEHDDHPVLPTEELQKSSVVREDWMTKPKEGWLSMGKKAETAKEEGVSKTEMPSRPAEGGLYDPKGPQDGRRQMKGVVGDGGASWRLRALKRMKERSQMEEKSLKQIAEERGMDLNRMMQDAERGQRRRPRDSPHHRSYLDDVQTEQSRMKKPHVGRSSFTRSKREMERQRPDASKSESPAGMNKFPNDGSFFQMFSEMSDSGLAESKAEDLRLEVKEDALNTTRDNLSIAEKLRQQLKAGLPLDQANPGPGSNTPSIPVKSETKHKKRRDIDTTAENRALYKRSRRRDEDLDIDKTLARNISRHRRFDVREDLNVEMEYDFGVGSDLFERKGKKNRKETLSDQQNREKQRRIRNVQRMQTLQEQCPYCFDSQTFPKNLVVSIGTAAYLRVPEKGALDPKHCIIVPLEHAPSTREVDDNVWTEIRNFKKALIQMNHAKGRDVIFLETAMELTNHKRHAYVECIPVKHDVLEKAPIYFKKAIDDATADWSQHHSKRCIETGMKGLHGSIPAHFPYFHVEFNLSNGFVHVIDDESSFDPHLGRRVLMGLLKRPAEDMYKRTERQSVEEQKQFVNLFLKDWHAYDWTLSLS